MCKHRFPRPLSSQSLQSCDLASAAIVLAVSCQAPGHIHHNEFVRNATDTIHTGEERCRSISIRIREDADRSQSMHGTSFGGALSYTDMSRRGCSPSRRCTSSPSVICNPGRPWLRTTHQLLRNTASKTNGDAETLVWSSGTAALAQWFGVSSLSSPVCCAKWHPSPKHRPSNRSQAHNTYVGTT